MKFIRSGQRHKPFPGSAEVVEQVPLGFHRVGFNPDDGFYLDQVPALTVPSKVYGKMDNRADRIYTTYRSRSGSTGVLLTGEKGGGKTMLANKICLRAIGDGVPVIICDKGSNMSHPGFSHLLAQLDFPFVCLMDEFEKCFDQVKEQSALLPVLDGIATGQRLILITVNDKRMISEYMIDRPGRIYYSFDYDGIDEDVILDYCADHGISDAEAANIAMYSDLHGNLSFDGLKAVVEEMNRYSMTFKEAIADLNMASKSISTWEVGIVDGRDFVRISFVDSLVDYDQYFLDRENTQHAISKHLTKVRVNAIMSIFDEHEDEDKDLKFDIRDITSKPYTKATGFVSDEQYGGLRIGFRRHKNKPADKFSF